MSFRLAVHLFRHYIYLSRSKVFIIRPKDLNDVSLVLKMVY